MCDGEALVRYSLLRVYKTLTSQMFLLDCKRCKEATGSAVRFCLTFFGRCRFREELWLQSDLGSLSFPLEHGGLDSRSRACVGSVSAVLLGSWLSGYGTMA